MKKNILISFAVACGLALVSLVSTIASASTQDADFMAKLQRRHHAIVAHCAQSHGRSRVCEGRAACVSDPQSASCNSYCNINPVDRVCDVGFEGSPYPSTDTPYPWARSGSFCQMYPYNIGCYRSGTNPWESGH